MKYTTELSENLAKKYAQGATAEDLAKELNVPSRSVIAKLSSMGVYEKKQYLNKRGELPIRKSVYIDKIASYTNSDPKSLESLEKVNKGVLRILEQRLSAA